MYKFLRELANITCNHELTVEWGKKYVGDSKVRAHFSPLLLLVLGEFCDIDCTELVILFSIGFPMIGRMGAPGVYQESSGNVSLSVKELLSSHKVKKKMG